MKQLKITLCIAAAFFISACGNLPQTSSAESTPPAPVPSETSAVRPVSSQEASASEDAAGDESAVTNSDEALYKDYFSAEIQWQGTYLSGDEEDQLGSGAPYDTTETRYSYTAAPEGTVQRQTLQRDADLGNWRSRSEEPLPAALAGISEVTTPYGLPVPNSGGKLFLVQNKSALIQTDENGENLVMLYESNGMISKLAAGEEIVFFIENEDTLCRLHLASGVSDKMPLPDTSFSRYVPISNFTVQIYGQEYDSYLLNFQTRQTTPVTAADVDEMGRLRYKMKH